MEARFIVVISMKTLRGYMITGQFFVGNDPKYANDLFAQLEGVDRKIQSPVLKMELQVEKAGDRQVLQQLSCTLQQLTANTRCIVRETFKLFNLE